MKYYFSPLFFIALFACDSIKNTTASSIEFKPLTNYQLNDNIHINEPTTYKYITKDEDFHSLFHMTKASMNTAIVPDFTTQSVVAIMLQPSTKVIELEITKAIVEGEELQINYTLTDTTSWATYEQSVTAVATIPKNTSIKTVSFYTKGVKEYSTKVEE